MKISEIQRKFEEILYHDKLRAKANKYYLMSVWKIFRENVYKKSLYNEIKLVNLNTVLFLDYCCGVGQYSVKTCRMLKNAMGIGIDISKFMIYEAKKNIKQKELSARIELINCDGEFLPFKNQIFDFSIIISALHHLPNVDLAIKNLKASLKKNGRVLLFEPTSFNLFANILRIISKKFNLGYVSKNEKPLNPYELINLLVRNHFHIKKLNFQIIFCSYLVIL
ncbi:MAG: class I SAM-dependent methyltransferase [Candidatus Helarchaeota archaeon]